MIGSVNVRVSAAHPDVPLREIPLFRGSACTVGVEGVPTYFGGVVVTGVRVSVENALGETVTVGARRSGCMWVATLPAAHFAAPGDVRNGLKIAAVGLEEDGETEAEWTLGCGDVCIINADGVPVPGEAWQNVHLRDDVPGTPTKGDLAKIGAEWKIYDGSAWQTLGGGGGGGSVVESETNPGYAANADAALTAPWSGIGGKPASFKPSLHAASHGIDGSDRILPGSIGALSVEGGIIRGPLTLYGVESVSLLAVGAGGLGGGIEVYSGSMQPASIKKDDVEVATEDELIVRMDLVGDGSAASPYAVQLGGVTQTFAQVKALAETRNAVIRRGRGTYRITYVGASEMMWDCTGTVQGAVMTGTIHMFREGDVVQLVEARELALKSDIPAAPSDARVTIRQGGVEKGFFTLNQGTDKTIDLDAGGGGGDTKCLLYIRHGGSSSQYVQWTGHEMNDQGELVEHIYKITGLIGHIIFERDGVQQFSQYSDTMLIPVEGNVYISDDGYSNESEAFLDNQSISTSSSTYNTTGKHSMSISFGDCLEQSTPITMADGTTKLVCELRVGDKVLAVNPETMQLEADEVSACDAGCIKMHNKSDVWTFADGSSVMTVKPHQFFNVRTGRMEYIADFKIGDEVRNADGTTTALAGHERLYGSFYHNTLYTRRFNNYFAAGILTGNRHSVKWGWLWRKENGVA